MVTKRGSSPTPISAILAFASAVTSKTETELLSGLTTHTERSSGLIAIGPEEVLGCSAFFGLATAVAARRVNNQIAEGLRNSRWVVEIRGCDCADRENNFITFPF